MSSEVAESGYDEFHIRYHDFNCQMPPATMLILKMRKADAITISIHSNQKITLLT